MQCVRAVSLQLEPEYTKVVRGFHGTSAHNLEGIARNGLLKVGNPLNPSKAVDAGYFGTPYNGVYVSTCITISYDTYLSVI